MIDPVIIDAESAAILRYPNGRTALGIGPIAASWVSEGCTLVVVGPRAEVMKRFGDEKEARFAEAERSAKDTIIALVEDYARHNPGRMTAASELVPAVRQLLRHPR